VNASKAERMDQSPVAATKDTAVLARVLVLDSDCAQVWELRSDEILRAGAVIEPERAWLSSSGFGVLIVGGRPHEVPEFIRSLPHELRTRVVGSFTADPATLSLTELRGNVTFILHHQNSA